MLKKRIWSHAKTRTLPEELPAAGHPGPIFKLTEAVFELIVPIVTADIIDNGVRTGDVGYVWRMGGVMLLLGVVGLCCALVCQKMASIASQGFGTVLRNEMYAISTHFPIRRSTASARRR